MAIPEEFNNDLTLWFNNVVGNLSQANNELSMSFKYKIYFTPEQWYAIKNIVKVQIDAAMAGLDLIKAEIDNV